MLRVIVRVRVRVRVRGRPVAVGGGPRVQRYFCGGGQGSPRNVANIVPGASCKTGQTIQIAFLKMGMHKIKE